MDKLGKLVNVQVSYQPLWDRFGPEICIGKPGVWAKGWVHVCRPVCDRVRDRVGNRIWDRVRDRVVYAD